MLESKLSFGPCMQEENQADRLMSEEDVAAIVILYEEGRMAQNPRAVQVEALEAILERERADAKARTSRQKLTVERLRRQIVELQVSQDYIDTDFTQQAPSSSSPSIELHCESFVLSFSYQGIIYIRN